MGALALEDDDDDAPRHGKSLLVRSRRGRGALVNHGSSAHVLAGLL